VKTGCIDNPKNLVGHPAPSVFDTLGCGCDAQSRVDDTRDRGIDPGGDREALQIAPKHDLPRLSPSVAR
jgi:hypothetical protein